MVKMLNIMNSEQTIISMVRPKVVTFYGWLLRVLSVVGFLAGLVILLAPVTWDKKRPIFETVISGGLLLMVSGFGLWFGNSLLAGKRWAWKLFIGFCVSNILLTIGLYFYSDQVFRVGKFVTSCIFVYLFFRPNVRSFFNKSFGLDDVVGQGPNDPVLSRPHLGQEEDSNVSRLVKWRAQIFSLHFQNSSVFRVPLIIFMIGRGFIMFPQMQGIAESYRYGGYPLPGVLILYECLAEIFGGVALAWNVGGGWRRTLLLSVPLLAHLIYLVSKATGLLKDYPFQFQSLLIAAFWLIFLRLALSFRNSEIPNSVTVEGSAKNGWNGFIKLFDRSTFRWVGWAISSLVIVYILYLRWPSSSMSESFLKNTQEVMPLPEKDMSVVAMAVSRDENHLVAEVDGALWLLDLTSKTSKLWHRRQGTRSWAPSWSSAGDDIFFLESEGNIVRLIQKPLNQTLDDKILYTGSHVSHYVIHPNEKNIFLYRDTGGRGIVEKIDRATNTITTLVVSTGEENNKLNGLAWLPQTDYLVYLQESKPQSDWMPEYEDHPNRSVNVMFFAKPEEMSVRYKCYGGFRTRLYPISKLQHAPYGDHIGFVKHRDDWPFMVKELRVFEVSTARFWQLAETDGGYTWSPNGQRVYYCFGNTIRRGDFIDPLLPSHDGSMEITKGQEENKLWFTPPHNGHYSLDHAQWSSDGMEFLLGYRQGNSAVGDAHLALLICNLRTGKSDKFINYNDGLFHAPWLWNPKNPSITGNLFPIVVNSKPLLYQIVNRVKKKTPTSKEELLRQFGVNDIATDQKKVQELINTIMYEQDHVSPSPEPRVISLMLHKWNYHTGEQSLTLSLGGGNVNGFAWDHQSNHVYIVNNGQLELHDYQNRSKNVLLGKSSLGLEILGSELSISTDGLWLAYATYANVEGIPSSGIPQYKKVYRMDLHTKKWLLVGQLPDAVGHDFSLNEDGTWLAFVKPKETNSEIWFMNMLTGKSYFVCEGSHPTWRPRHHEITYFKEQAVYKMDIKQVLSKIQ